MSYRRSALFPPAFRSLPIYSYVVLSTAQSGYARIMIPRISVDSVNIVCLYDMFFVLFRLRGLVPILSVSVFLRNPSSFLSLSLNSSFCPVLSGTTHPAFSLAFVLCLFFFRLPI